MDLQMVVAAFVLVALVFLFLGFNLGQSDGAASAGELWDAVGYWRERALRSEARVAEIQADMPWLGVGEEE